MELNKDKRRATRRKRNQLAKELRRTDGPYRQRVVDHKKLKKKIKRVKTINEEGDITHERDDISKAVHEPIGVRHVQEEVPAPGERDLGSFGRDFGYHSSSRQDDEGREE